MSGKLTRRKRRRLREIRLQDIREANRIARRHKYYNPNATGFTSPRINKKFHATEPLYNSVKHIKLPREMNFAAALTETINILRVIRDELLYGESSEVLIDQTELKDISPEAAVALLAELHRCMSYTSKKKHIRGNYPSNSYATKMLRDIGFYRFLNIPTPRIDKGTDLRTYFKVRTGNRSSGPVVGNLISSFKQVIEIDPISKKRLYEALIECMDNVREHAYLTGSQSADLIGEWWMAGFCDVSSGQIAFVFLDQGVGVPTTLKMKHSVRIKKLLTWTESVMIRHAVMHGLSRRKSARHGNGLPSLREFIDVSTTGGFLRVISNNGDFTYYKNHPSRAVDIAENYLGTLIIWSMQVDKENIDEDGTIDLRSRSAQLRLQI